LKLNDIQFVALALAASGKLAPERLVIEIEMEIGEDGVAGLYVRKRKRRGSRLL
jgi:hypothetical protein